MGPCRGVLPCGSLNHPPMPCAPCSGLSSSQHYSGVVLGGQQVCAHVGLAIGRTLSGHAVLAGSCVFFGFFFRAPLRRWDTGAFHIVQLALVPPMLHSGAPPSSALTHASTLTQLRSHLRFLSHPRFHSHAHFNCIQKETPKPPPPKTSTDPRFHSHPCLLQNLLAPADPLCNVAASKLEAARRHFAAQR